MPLGEPQATEVGFHYKVDEELLLNIFKQARNLISFFFFLITLVIQFGKPRRGSAVGQQVKNPTAGAQVTVETQVQSPALCSGLRIWHCHSHSYSSDSIPDPEISTCCGCGH